MRGKDISFVSITVDAAEDTPEVLNRYAQDFEASPPDWVFLTGQPYRIDELGEQVFRVVVDKATHTDNILLIDRWGKYRDRFKWDDPYDMKRFVQVAQSLIDESEPPFGESIHTRNALAGHEPSNWDTVPWIREFFLRMSDGSKWSSRDLTGEVWIASFFFSTCPGICVEQNQYLAGLQTRLKDHPARIVSITTDPQHDTPQVLAQYARTLGANPDKWWFGTTGDEPLVKRVSGEFFGASAGSGHHSSELFVVDRWGNVRGRFDWQQASDEASMLALIDQLNDEQRPPAELKLVTGTSVSETDED